jgi:hypothetical protein
VRCPGRGCSASREHKDEPNESANEPVHGRRTYPRPPMARSISYMTSSV